MSQPTDVTTEPRRPDRPVGLPRRRLLVATGALGVVALLLLVLTVNVASPGAVPGDPIVGRPAPAFELETLDGQRLALAEMRGSPVVVNFWASWCIPCREEAPLLTAAARDHEAQGLRVVGIVYQDSREAARDFMTRYGQTYPGLLDPDGRAAVDFGVFGIPETFYIDRAGVVRSRQVGPVTAEGLARMIQAILR